MVNIRTESLIDTNFSVQILDNSNFDGSEKNYLDVLIYINGSKVFQSKNVAVNNVNDLRLIFNRSYISTKRVYVKVSVGIQHTKYYPNPCVGRFGTPPLIF